MLENQGPSYLACDLAGETYRLRVDYHHGEEDEQRARLERQRLDLSHPHLAPYTDIGINSRLSWRVGPHLVGSTLRDFWEKGCGDPNLVRSFLLHGLSGLEALHAKGIVYDNWAFENLVFHQDRWILDDVGWVPDRFRNVAGSFSDRFERELVVVAPERIMGSAVAPSSEYFALGACAYILMSGQPPFGQVEGLVGTLGRVLQEPPVPLAQIVPDVPPDLVEAIELLLDKRPEERDVFKVRERLAGRRTVGPSSKEWTRYLSEVREAGQVEDESGKFTLNPTLALSKLKDFQFSGAQDFLIPLVASCLSSGAKEVKVRASGGLFQLSHSSSNFTEEELNLLFVAACSGGGTSLSKLGLAVTGALAAGASKVELSSGPYRLKFDRLEQPRVTTGRDLGFTFKCHGEVVGKIVPAWLAEMLRFSPVPIHWNRTRLDVEEDQFVTTRSLDGVDFTLETTLASEWPGLYLRVDGLSFKKQANFLLPGVRMVLAGPWKTDLSFRSLVAEERQLHLINEATEWLFQLASQDAVERPYTASRSGWYSALLEGLNREEELEKIHLHIVKNTPYPPPERDPQVENSCTYVYDNRLEEWPKACRILALPAYLGNRSWPDLRSLALDAYGTENDGFWLFLLQAFLKLQNLEPSREEVRELLSRLPLIPDEKRYLWDPSLQATLSKLIGRMPQPAMELRKEWLDLLPGHDFPQTTSWLRSGGTAGSV